MEDQNDLFKEIFEKSPIGILFYDKEGKLIDANQSALKIARVSKFRDIRGINLFVNPFIETKREELLEKGIIRFQSSRDLDTAEEYGFYTPTESGIIYIDYTVSVTDSGFLMQMQDITEQKQMQNALHENEEKFRVALRNSPTAVFQQDFNLRYTWVYQPHSHFSEENLIGYTDWDVLNSKDAERITKIKKRVLSEKIPLQEEVSIYVNRKKFYYILSLEPLFDIEGNIIGLSGASTDITEGKKSENKLKYQANLLNNVNDPIIATDLTLVITSWNKAAEKVYGYNANEAIGKLVSDVIKSDFSDKKRKIALETLSNGQECLLEVKQYDKDGKSIYIEATTLPIYSDGKITGYVAVNRDVTKRKIAEGTLQTTLQRFYTILDNMRASILLVTEEDIIEFANQAFCDYFSLTESPEELRGITASKMIKKIKNVYQHPDNEVNRIQEIVNQWQPVLGEEIQMQGGKTCLRDFIPLFVNEKPYGRLWLHLDITKRKKNENELRKAHANLENMVRERTEELEKAYESLKENEEKFRLIFDGAEDSIVLNEINKNGMPGKIIEANEVTTKRLGYTKKELLNMYPSEVVAPECRAEMPKNAEKLKKEGHVIFEIIHMAKDGHRIPVEVNNHLIEFKGKKTALTVVRDITQRREMEKQLKESEEIYRKLLRESFDGWAIHSEGIVLAANNAAAEILGGTIKDFVGKPVINFVHPDYREDVKRRSIKMYKERGSEPLFEEKFLKLNGTVIDIEAVATSLTYEGNPAIQVVFRDITARKKAEKQLKETIGELERSNKELQSFAYITSHDLQEPLRTMSSYAGLLKRRYGGQLDNDADDFLDYMVKGAFRMKDMIQGLLDYSRIGTQREEFIEFNSEESLDNALTNLKSSIEECHAEITHDDLPTIIGNREQISRIFQNLIGNALKFRKEDEHPRIHISARKENNEYIFSVSDNGIGIEEPYTDHIFEVFKRLHAIDEYQGAGIGLAIVKRIIDNYGGRIWVESSPGKGSTFYFTLKNNI